MKTIAIATAILLVQLSHAQEFGEDTKSVDAVIKALYEVISGPKGQERNWPRFKNLFTEDAKMLAMVKSGEELRSFRLTPEDYVQRSGPFLVDNGFFENEIHRDSHSYGPICQVWTTYESRLGSKDAKPFDRGINSVQLVQDKGRWWIQSITWAGESAAGPIPKRYLRN